MMELYLIRHGIAEEGETAKADSERPLTAEGRRKLRAVLRCAAAAEVQPSLIVASPYRRAIETAQVAAEVFGFKGTLLQTKALTPASTPQAVWEEVRVHRGESQMLLCGHEPLLSATAAFLIGAPGAAIEFKKASLARIDLERFGPVPEGELKWLLPAKLAHAPRPAGRK